MGKVSTQDKTIFETTWIFDFLVTVPIPKIEPTETWVVETGKPWILAVVTNNPVMRFALKP